MLIEGFKHLYIYLILAPKFSNFFISFNKAFEIFGNFLTIIHLIISPILNFYAIWTLQMPKCPSKISPKIPKFFSSLCRAFEIFGSFLGQYPLDDISFINFFNRSVTSKLISSFFSSGNP